MGDWITNLSATSATKTYGNSNAHEYHMGTHQGERDKVSCDLCGSLFSSDGNMLKHKKGAHGIDPDSPYEFSKINWVS